MRTFRDIAFGRPALGRPVALFRPAFRLGQESAPAAPQQPPATAPVLGPTLMPPEGASLTPQQRDAALAIVSDTEAKLKKHDDFLDAHSKMEDRVSYFGQDDAAAFDRLEPTVTSGRNVLENVIKRRIADQSKGPNTEQDHKWHDLIMALDDQQKLVDKHAGPPPAVVIGGTAAVIGIAAVAAALA